MGRRLRPTHRVDVRRRLNDPEDERVETNAWGEPVAAEGEESRRELVAEGVPVSFQPRSTFIREDTGERVEKPATVTVPRNEPLRTNDLLVMSDPTTDAEDGTEYLVTDEQPTIDRRRGGVVSRTYELESRS